MHNHNLLRCHLLWIILYIGIILQKHLWTKYSRCWLQTNSCRNQKSTYSFRYLANKFYVLNGYSTMLYPCNWNGDLIVYWNYMISVSKKCTLIFSMDVRDGPTFCSSWYYYMLKHLMQGCAAWSFVDPLDEVDGLPYFSFYIFL